MVTKGIITSIDFNGNTCQVRIPLFETAGNDPITGTAIVSNTPGSYNGYKVGDVVLVAFEDGKMQNPVIVGKLYLGAAKEKQDPRGTINVETTTASKSASLPADAVLTANVDSNVPNTNAPFGSLASIANNLNSLNTDVNQLDKFTRNQFNSVITDVNDQGEQLRSEIKQTAENIEANVVHKHQDGSQKALGWDLTTDSWKINAQDTVTDENGETKVKDINIVTITRDGMTIAGDLKLNGYPRNITVRYAQNGSDKDYPYLYKFKQDSFPDTKIDKTWYYNKYIKITEADKEKYILISSENIDDYTITPGETAAYIYNLEEINHEWKTETPARVNGQYIWQWTHTESFSFDGDKWNEQDDDKVVCITGAQGEKGNAGKDGYTTVTVMLYKRSKTSISDNPISDNLYYKFSDKKLYTDDTCTTEYTLPAGWSYTISDAGDSSNGDLYCIAAVANSNTDSDSIPASEWAGPTLYVENGVSGTSVAQLTLYQRAASTPNNPTKDGTWTYNAADGSLTCNNEATGWKTSIPSGTDPCYESHAAVLVTGLGTTTVTTWSSPAKFVENGTDGTDGISIKEVKQWYILWLASASTDPTKPTNNTEPAEPATPSTVESWMSTPPEAVNGYVIWTCYGSIFSDDNPSGTRHIEYSDPVKDNAYALAQGKTTNYYSPTEPIHNVKKGDCWFDTGTAGKETLKQWDGSAWQDIGGEVVQNKVTANYINALDITAKKITVLDKGNNTLFNADGLSNDRSVSIGGFTVDSNRLYAGNPGTDNGIELSSIGTNKASIKVGSNFSVDNTGAIKSTSGTIGCFTVSKDKLYSNSHSELNSTNPGVYLGADGISIGSNFKITAGNVIISDYTKSINKKYRKTTFDVIPVPTPEGWENWNYTEWSSELPVRENGKYIWEWTKEVKGNSTDDISTWEDKGKICITGAKGDPGSPGSPGPAGATPYVQNGNWWIGNDDTGVKAEGTDGHTPVIKIGENGNWYIDGKDTGVLAKGTPGEPGKTGRSVLSVTKFYKTAASKPDKPSNKKPADWYTSPPAWKTGNNYYESDLTIYDSADSAGQDYSWSDVIENSMLTVDFINSLGITAQGLKVVNGNSTILSANIANETPNSVQIGGFTVDSNRLYAGTPGTGSGIELSSYSAGLIAYSSNNQGKASTYAVSKITVNKATDLLTVYIRSYAESDYDYTIISKPNTQTYPTDYASIYKEEHTHANQKSGSTLANYTKVEYHGLKQNDWIYVVYRKDQNNDVGADTGYFLIPETADVSISNVGDYYFVRDSAFDIRGASINVGTNFSVDNTGAIKSTSGTIGNLSIAEDGLAYKSSSTSFKIGQESSDPRMPKYAIYSSTQKIDDCIMGFKDSSGSYSWVEFKPDGYYTYSSSDMTNAVVTGKIPYNFLKNICWLNTPLGYAHTGSRATCPQIIVLEASIKKTSYTTYDLSKPSFSINEIIGAQITEKRTEAKSDWDRQWFSVDETKTKITIYNNSSEPKIFSVLVIAI